LAPFGAQKVLMAPAAGVPEALYEGVKAAEDAEAHAIPDFKLNRQLELEASMDGVEDSHKPRIVIIQEVHDEHFSNMPGFCRREWNHDPFYGWRSQDDSKVPEVPAVRRALEAERQAAIDARKNHAHRLAEQINVAEDPFMATQVSLSEPMRPRPVQSRTVDSGGTKVTLASLEAKQLEPQQPERQLELPGPSWHDAEIGERILAASHMRGNWLVQSEAVKQKAIIEYDLPVHLFVGGALERDPDRTAPLPAAGDLIQSAANSLRTWSSMFTPSRPSEAHAPAHSRASTDATMRVAYKPDPYDNYHSGASPSTNYKIAGASPSDPWQSNRSLATGPAFKPPPGPLWMFGM